MSNHRRPSRRMRRSPLSDILLLILLVVLTVALIFLIFRYLLPAGNTPGGADVSPQGSPPQSDPVQTGPSGAPSGDPSPEPSGGEDPSDPEYPEVPWYLILVNPAHALPEDFTPDLTTIGNTSMSFDTRAYDALRQMISGCREAGLQPYICSAYRTQETQETLYQNKINRLIAQGYGESDAAVEAGKVVAVPGTSEHQLGLAVDIVDINNQNLDESQEKTEVQKWLMEHSWEYGFILRYPNDKSELTGIIYEPWHYRYVGEEIAKEITEQDICMEEYMAEHYGIELHIF